MLNSFHDIASRSAKPNHSARAHAELSSLKSHEIVAFGFGTLRCARLIWGGFLGMCPRLASRRIERALGSGHTCILIHRLMYSRALSGTCAQLDLREYIRCRAQQRCDVSGLWFVWVRTLTLPHSLPGPGLIAYYEVGPFLVPHHHQDLSLTDGV